MTIEHPSVRRCLELATQAASPSNSQQKRTMLESLIGLQWQDLEGVVLNIVGDDSYTMRKLGSAEEFAVKALHIATDDPAKAQGYLEGVRKDLHTVQGSIDLASKRT